jgi:uncharacterized OB-fold protein
MIENMTLEKAIESNRMGYDITFDGDKKEIMIGTKCNRCNNYFYGDKYTYYCEECEKEGKIIN